MEEKITRVIDALNKKHFKAAYAKDAAEAKKMVMELIADDKKVGFGGSVTLDETGIFDAVVNDGRYEVYSTALAKRTGGDPDLAKRLGMTADVYLTSTNAVTEEGDLINIDGVGNRVAAMFFGPPKVIVVAGKNKIAKGPHDAIARIKAVACPKNAKRLDYDIPCKYTGKCQDCSSPQRFCNVTVRIQYPPGKTEIHVIMVDEELGY